MNEKTFNEELERIRKRYDRYAFAPSWVMRWAMKTLELKTMELIRKYTNG